MTALLRMESSRTRPGERGEILRATDRVKRRGDYLEVQAHGRRVQARHFVVIVQPRPLGAGPESPTRIGVTVTKKVSGAVGRNRVKRLVREVFRRNRDRFPAGCDVVFIARAGAEGLDYETVLAEVTSVERAMHAAARAAPAAAASRPRRPGGPRAGGRRP